MPLPSRAGWDYTLIRNNTGHGVPLPPPRDGYGRLGYYPAKPCAARFQAPQNAKPRRVPRACWLSPAVEWFSRDRLGYAE